jgi:hypothetical protein
MSGPDMVGSRKLSKTMSDLVSDQVRKLRETYTDVGGVSDELCTRSA